ncbi:hypothetical protein SteCoe_21871 [Stentor coeruleus]|uniref:Uncharacterized protein n=1 Tax=Stentor coeruleus TaxID=5963 RepID=A0A1R2BNK9_9CILI|nr:hypothetical protein SteCoe_21871 [Stentor coeruleus]
MELYFSSVLNGNEYFIELDPSLTPAQEKCNDKTFYLNLTVPYVELPIPSISLEGPATENMICGDGNITISNTLDSTDYSYHWTASPYSDDLDTFLSTINTYQVIIPIAYAQLGDFNVTCKVTSLLYNTSATDSIVVVITSESFLVVDFSTSTDIIVSKSDTIFIKGLVSGACGINIQSNQTETYKWEYISSNALNFDSILLNSPDPSALLILPNTLESSMDYSFKLTATLVGTSTTGFGEINIHVKPSDLIISFSKNSGTISKTQDLTVKASVIDPDSTSPEIIYDWSCFEDSELCKNSTMGELEFKGDTDTLVIPKDSLRDGALYMFLLTANLTNKQGNQSVEFYVDGLAQGELFIQLTEDNNLQNIFLNGIAAGMTVSMYTWNINPSISAKIETKYSFFSIPKKYLSPATDYNISLTVASSSGNPLTSYIIYHMPAAPDCLTPAIDFLTTDWQIAVTKCTSDSLSLTYEFGCNSSSNLTLWFTDKMYENSAKILIPQICDYVFAKVCNGFSCKIAGDNPPSGNKVIGDVISDFNNDLLNNIYIPNVFLYYSYLLSTQDQWNQVISKIDNYFRSENPNKGFRNTFNSLLNSMMLKNNLITPASADITIKLIEYIISTYKLVLTSNQMVEITTCLGKLVSFLDFSKLSQMIKDSIKSYYETVLPGSEPLIQNSDISVYASRTLAESLSSQNINGGKNSLEIPNNVQLDANTICDTEYIVYPSNNTEVKFEVSFYTSGTYTDSKIQMAQQQSTQLNSGTVYATVGGDFSSGKSYECAYLETDGTWMTTGCKIAESADGKTKMGLEHQSTFKVYEVSSTGSCPLIIACAWILIALFGIIAFHITDKNQEEDYKTANKYATYAFTSICIRQANGRRVSSIIYLFSIHIIFICFVGVLMLRTGNPKKSTDKKYGVFSGENIIPGIIGWILTQILAIPIYYYTFNKYVSMKSALIAKYTALSISILGFIGIIAMTAVYCKEFSFYWVVNYFIFLPFQIIIEIIFAAIVWRRQKSWTASISNKVSPEIEELNKSRRGEDINTFKKGTQSQAIVDEKGLNSSSVDISNIN